MNNKHLKRPSQKKHQTSETEWRRLKTLTLLEEKAYEEGHAIVAGVDEAGRGPLAGPVVAAACIIPPKLFIPGINDSKKLSKSQREELFKQIVNNPKIIYSIGSIDHEEIDRINIYQSTIEAMKLAVDGLETKPQFLLVDGLKLPHTIEAEKIIKGDQKSQSIAAASIIAKVTRDRIMREYHEKYPHYGFDTHKGYPTSKHLEALKTHGPCPIHRRTFKGVLVTP